MSKDFSDQLDFISPDAGKVAQASGKGTDKHGRVRKTIFLPPELIASIEIAFEEQGYTRLMDFYQWLVLRGWEAFENGDRPNVQRKPGNQEISFDE